MADENAGGAADGAEGEAAPQPRTSEDSIKKLAIVLAVVILIAAFAFLFYLNNWAKTHIGSA
ncbi:MAG: hypothetical protein HYU66_17170 [Armatimonadetes bacterium]|nr:hypothetical protein [Armatimonadota bacterium]